MSQLLLNRFHCGGPDKGFGFHLAARNSPIAFCRSFTLLKDPRRTRLEVSSPNHRSTRFNQLELVGTSAGENEDVL